MNGIEQIANKIQADVQAEIDEIRESSGQEVQAIHDKYEALKKDEYWKVIAQGTKTAEERMERILSMAELDAKKSILQGKQDMVSKAFEMTVSKMAALPEEDYISLLAGFAVQGSVRGDEKLIFSKSDRTSIGKKVCALANERLESAGKTGKLTLSEQTRNIKGGVILTDGSVDTNYSLEALVADRKNELTEQVTKILFG